MSELARKNGWRGFDGIGQRVEGGYQYVCDGTPTLRGCGEEVTVPRSWVRTGAKKSGWLVCYGLENNGEPDLDVVLTFCPRCATVVVSQSSEREPA